ncbi:HNH endonuclease [Candidatus Pacearchaeota archaeon]|nr:HNH endonuclease [Candidatus Pacearchaeota archaeon]
MKRCKYCNTFHSRKSEYCTLKCTNAAYYIKNKETHAARKHRYYLDNKDKIAKYTKIWQEENKESISKYNSERYVENRDHMLERNKQYDKKHKGQRAAATAKRRAKKLNATPKWLTKDHLEKIKEIYKNRPEGYHVDHIVPLQGKDASGLHTPWNLQYLTKEENLRKSNKVEV